MILTHVQHLAKARPPGAHGARPACPVRAAPSPSPLPTQFCNNNFRTANVQRPRRVLLCGVGRQRGFCMRF